MTAQAEDRGPTGCFQTRSISRHELSSTADCALYRGLRHRVAALIKSRDHSALRSAQQRTGLVLRTPGFSVLCPLCFLSATASCPCRRALFTDRTADLILGGSQTQKTGVRAVSGFGGELTDSDQ